MTEMETGFRRSAPVVVGGAVAAALAVAKGMSFAYALADSDSTFWANLLLGVDGLLFLAFAALAASMLLHRRAGLSRVRVPAVAVLVLQPMYFLVYTAKYIALFIHYPAPLAWFSIFEYYGVPFLLGLLLLALFARAVASPARRPGFLVPAAAIAFAYSLLLNVYTLVVSLSYWTSYTQGFKFFAQMAFYAFHAFVLLPVLLLAVSLAATPVEPPPGSAILG